MQTEDKAIGIEITEAIAPQTAQIDGEHAKWRFGKQTVHDKQECKRLIEKYGGTVDTIGISYPVVNSDMEWKIFEKALRKKIIILQTYKAKGFAKKGLFIFFNELPIPFDLEASMPRFAEIKKR